ncbi:MAG: C39 family peptidase, partial [Candidatus Absconditabacterales bacterium]
MIRNSVGVPLWKHLFVDYQNGNSKDILQDGNVSCAYFVSCVLKTFGLSPASYANVLSTEKALLQYGRQAIDPATRPQDILPGSVIVRSQQSGEEKQDIYGNARSGHYHIGFYIGGSQAISNMSDRFVAQGLELGVPQQHHYTYNDRRPIKSILTFRFDMSLQEHISQVHPTMLINKQLEIPFVGQTADWLHKPEQQLTSEEIDRGMGLESNLKHGRLCGLACILMANNYFSANKKTYRECIEYRNKTHGNNLLYRGNATGRYYGGLISIAKERGLQGQEGNTDYDDIIGFKMLLADCIDNNKVLICSVSPEFDNTKRGGHLVVIKGYNRNGYQEELIIND